jgi:hypothetical protein
VGGSDLRNSRRVKKREMAMGIGRLPTPPPLLFWPGHEEWARVGPAGGQKKPEPWIRDPSDQSHEVTGPPLALYAASHLTSVRNPQEASNKLSELFFPLFIIPRLVK